jgi:hypothetical protein
MRSLGQQLAGSSRDSSTTSVAFLDRSERETAVGFGVIEGLVQHIDLPASLRSRQNVMESA